MLIKLMTLVQLLIILLLLSVMIGLPGTFDPGTVGRSAAFAVGNDVS